MNKNDEQLNISGNQTYSSLYRILLKLTGSAATPSAGSMGPYFDQLPVNITIKILDYLSPEDLRMSQLICKKARFFSAQMDLSRLIKAIILRDFTCDKGLPANGSYKHLTDLNWSGLKLMATMLLSSEDKTQMIEKMQKLAFNFNNMIADKKAYHQASVEFLLEWLFIALIGSNNIRQNHTQTKFSFQNFDLNVRQIITSIKQRLSGLTSKQALGLAELCHKILTIPDNRVLSNDELKELLIFQVYRPLESVKVLTGNEVLIVSETGAISEKEKDFSQSRFCNFLIHTLNKRYNLETPIAELETFMSQELSQPLTSNGNIR